MILYTVIDYIRHKMDETKGLINLDKKSNEENIIRPVDILSEQHSISLQHQDVEVHHGDLIMYKKSSFLSNFSFVRSLEDINNSD